MNNNTININRSLDGRVLPVKSFAAFTLIALLILLAGCSGDTITAEGDSPAANVTMSLKSGTNPVFMGNASIYVFTGTDQFVEKKLNVTVSGNKLFTYMPVGTWNLVLLTCSSDISGQVIQPPYGGANTFPMWKTGLIAPANEFLSQAPGELRYEVLPNTAIIQDQLTTKQATLNRNVAKIQVILKTYTGFDAVSPGQNNYAYVDLLDVPTTLDWQGRYYPDKNNPEHAGNKPIREYFNFDAQLKADTVDFIVPAHRGSDAFDLQHNDTTTHKLRLRASMPLKGQSYFGKSPFEISFVPKINRIIQLVLTFRGEPETNLDVKVTVKEWADPIDQEVIFD